METKVLKSYCEISKKYYGVVVAKFGSAWKVVDFIPVEEEKGKLMSSPSEVRQDSYFSNENLLPCGKNQSRQICSCSGLKNSKCSPSMGYNFQCLYCSNLKIDYSKPKSIAGRRAGEVIELTQGQVVKIEFDDRSLTKIKVGCGWDPVSGGSSMDIDSSVVVSNGSAHELIYFGNLNHSSGCVIHHGDNLTGEGQGDDENITVDLDKVPQNRDRLIFVINIYNCDSRYQSLKDVRNMYITLTDNESGEKLCKYQVEQGMEYDTAIVIGIAFRSVDGWSFKAVGQGRRETDVHDLADNVRNMR